MSGWIDDLAESARRGAAHDVRGGPPPPDGARRRAPGGAQGHAARVVPPGDARRTPDGRRLRPCVALDEAIASTEALLPARARTAVAPNTRSRVGWLDDRLATAPDASSRRGTARRLVRPDRGRPPRLGDRSVQLPLHVLHAGGGARVAPEERDPDVRGVDAAARHLRRPRRPVDQGDRRRADRARGPADARADVPRGRPRARHLHHHERRAARPARRSARRGGRRSRDGLVRLVDASPVRRDDAA